MNENEVSERLSNYFPYGNAQVKYLVNCSKRYKYVYVEIPKVACSTVKRVLQFLEVDGDKSRLSENVHDRTRSPLATVWDMGVNPDLLFKGHEYFCFSFVRNPYSRILSAYLDKIIENEWERNRFLPALGFDREAKPTLRDFLSAIRDIPNAHKDIHWTPQTYILQKHKVDYDFIGHFECFGAAFSRVIKKIESDAPEELFTLRADHHKTNASDRVMQYIGGEERDLILEIFEHDFKVFGYSEDPHFGGV